MTSAYQPPSHSYSHPPPPSNVSDSVRLPSLKDLNFQYRSPGSQENPPLANGPPPSEHSRSRHESGSWGRPAPSSANGAPVAAPHETQKSHLYSAQKPDAAYMAQGVPMSQQTGSSVSGSNGPGAASSRGDAPSQNSMKRPRSPPPAVSASPGRSPHTAYPPHPSYPAQPSVQYHQGHPVSVPPPPSEAIHQPPAFSHPPPHAYGYPPPHMAQRHYQMPPPPPPAHAQSSPANSYPPPPPPEHWQQSLPPSQVPPQAQYSNFNRTTPVVPSNVDARNNPQGTSEADRAAAFHGTIHEIMKHCSVLYGFANRYAHAQAQGNVGPIQPSPQELQEMSFHASTVVRLLEELKRFGAEGEAAKEALSHPLNAAEEHSRPPKRPWEDMSREENGTPAPDASYPEAPPQYPPDEKVQSTAEQDMEIIRSKRATSTGGNAPGQPKSKYRKRSRATPPGKCHSCNIRETPEWRRGPDGARTLCNACGLHYAKLMRKREKFDGKAPAPIDLQTLRASTASARGSDLGDSPQVHSHRQPTLAAPSYDHQKAGPEAQQQPGHSGPYHLMPLTSSGPPPSGHGQPHQMMPPPPVPASHSENGNQVPPPPWLSSSRGYPPDQSYMRASHPASHTRASPQ